MISPPSKGGHIGGSGDLLQRSGGRAVAEFRALVGGSCNFFQVSVDDEAQTLKLLRKRVQEAVEEFTLKEAVLVHRKGILNSGEILVYAAAAADHRDAAFQAVDALRAGLKMLAKKEVV